MPYARGRDIGVHKGSENGIIRLVVRLTKSLGSLPPAEVVMDLFRRMMWCSHHIIFFFLIIF